MQAKIPVLSGRLLCAACVAYTHGIVVYALLAPPLLAVFAMTLFLVIVAACKKSPHFLIIIIVLSSFLGGTSNFHLLKEKENSFKEQYTGRYVTITGKVNDTSLGDDWQTLIVSADSITALGETVQKDFSVSVTTDTDKLFSLGDIISFSDIFSSPKKSNSHSFDYELYLYTKNISASFSLPTEYITLSHSDSSLSDKLSLFSQLLSDKIRTVIGGEEGEVAAAITLGDKSGFSDRLSNSFSKSGISHIVAVSGMHLSILIGFFFFLAARSRLHYKIRNVFGILLVIFYMAVTGFSPSVTRAGIMTICMLLAAILDRKEDIATSFFLSAAVILMLNPYTIFSASFLLSYAALAGILIFSKSIRGKLEFLPQIIPGFVKDIVAASFSASILTYPVLAYMFNSVSLLSVFTNVLVVPLVNIIFITVLLSAGVGFMSAPMGSILAFIPKSLIKTVILCSDTVASVPYCCINVKTPSLLSLICFAVLVTLFYLVLSGKKPGKTGTIALLLVICIISTSFILSSLFTSVTFFDMGQGDCALIKTHGGRSYLIDTGPDGDDTVSALKSVGLNKIDIIFISHSDKDHSGALADVLSTFPTKKVVLPRYDINGDDMTRIIDISVNSGVDVEFADGYCGYNLPGAAADVIWPSRTIMSDDSNSGSLVLRFDIKGNHFLFTGDIDSSAENDIIKTTEILDCDVLKVSHHGSSDASTDGFLKKVSADYSVISTGKDNAYGHPHDETLKRLEDSGSKILRTDECGDIKFTIDIFGNMRVIYEAD